MDSNGQPGFKLDEIVEGLKAKHSHEPGGHALLTSAAVEISGATVKIELVIGCSCKDKDGMHNAVVVVVTPAQLIGLARYALNVSEEAAMLQAVIDRNKP